ncbi:MAG: SDR family NAD(P)-dependent oxidoreductase [Candidatus Cyclobacteriaceae bacterium M3_2C_046]
MANYLIVGSGSTIGRSVIELLLKEDHSLTTVSRQQSGSYSGQVAHLQLNIMEEVIPHESIPQLDGLVYLPGTINLKPFRTLKPENFRHDLDVNLLGAVSVIQAALPKMKEQSAIVMFSSVAVQAGMPYHSTVAVSKGAVEGLVRSLAAELAPHVRVNAVAPSLVDTNLSQRLINSDEKQKAVRERHPLKTYGQPEDIAEMVTYLLSPKSRWITGQIIGIDGGLSKLRM